MRADTQYHDVTAIELDEIRSHTMDDGRTFYARCLVITMADGKKESISLFGDNGYGLLAVDGELDALNKAA